MSHEGHIAKLEAEAELGRQFLAYYKRHVANTTALPCQVEDEARGSCVYNWRRAFERDIEHCLGEALAALAPAAPAPPAENKEPRPAEGPGA